MRAVRMKAFGEPSEVLAIEELPTPQPGPGQVLVRMRVRPINPSDLFVIRGTYGSLPQLPATPGMEGAGVIEALGEGVAHLAIGQQVLPMAGGAWQEYVVADAARVMPLPPGLSDTQAATLVANPVTAWLLLHDELRVSPGAWVLQNAANSAVGRHVIQLARHAGIRTINVIRRRDVIDDLRAEGADEIIIETEDDVVERVRAITDGRGARYAIDSVGGDSGSRLAQALGAGGTLIVFGAISGQPLTIDGGTLLFRGQTLRGFWLAYWLRAAKPERLAELFGTLIPLVQQGVIRTPIAAEYDLADVRQAVAAAEGSERNGKIVLVG